MRLFCLLQYPRVRNCGVLVLHLDDKAKEVFDREGTDLDELQETIEEQCLDYPPDDCFVVKVIEFDPDDLGEDEGLLDLILAGLYDKRDPNTDDCLCLFGALGFPIVDPPVSTLP